MKKNRFILIYLTLFTTFIYGNNDCLKYLPMPTMDGLVAVVPYVEKNFPDKDCDGIIDKWDADLHSDKPDTDYDGTIDEGDSDDDNDGWLDAQEAAAGTDPLDPNSYPNTPPVAANDTATTTINTPVDIQVLANDYDSNTDTLSISAVTVSENDGNVTIVDNIIRYTPPLDFSGHDSFVYSISDGHGGEANATVTVTIAPTPTPTPTSTPTPTPTQKPFIFKLDNKPWVTKGESNNTHILKDINVSTQEDYENKVFIDVNDTIYFAADDGIHGYELWKSDGTSAGTSMVKDIIEGNESSMSSFNNDIISINSILFFQADNALWKSNGTDAGTIMLKDNLSMRDFRDVNGTLFFGAYDGIHGLELWKSDGTISGTMMVKDINVGDASSIGGYLDYPTSYNGTLFFGADDGIHGNELWKSDGTASGTVMVKDIREGSSGSGTGDFIEVNNTLFFTIDNVSGQTRELWKSDGTAEGTVIVKDFNEGSDSNYPSGFQNLNGTLYFYAHDFEHGSALWKSDGTTEGTVLVKDRPLYIISINNMSFFVTFEENGNYEKLWKANDGIDGAINIYSGSDITTYGNLNGDIFFKDVDGNESILLKSDGTQAGTVEIGRY